MEKSMGMMPVRCRKQDGLLYGNTFYKYFSGRYCKYILLMIQSKQEDMNDCIMGNINKEHNP